MLEQLYEIGSKGRHLPLLECHQWPWEGMEPAWTPGHGAPRIEVQADVLKIDVEGAELRVLKGATNILLTQVPHVRCETYPAQMEHGGSSYAELKAFLADAAYSFTALDEPNPMGIFHADLRSVRSN